MFGDLHRKMTGICEQCVCSVKSCCYALDDPSFLGLLDTLADNKHPVDFYTETFLAGTGIDFEGGTMGTLTTGKMLSCYQRRLRDTKFYKDNCPTQNIRWHAGDVRQAFNMGKIYANFNKNFSNSMSNDVGVDISYIKLSEKYKDIDTTISTKYMTRNYIESIFYISGKFLAFSNEDRYIVCQRCQSLNVYLDRFCLRCREKYPDDIFSRIGVANKLFSVTPWKSVDGFYNFLNDNLFTPTGIDLTKFADALFSLLTVENSLIAKQISKQNYPPFRDVKMWSNMFTSSLELDSELQTAWDIITPLDTSNLSKFRRYQISYLVLENISLRFLDIYTISRVFKKPDDGIRSSLSFGFFGDMHARNISKQIRSMGYDIVYSKDRDPDAIKNYDNDEYAVKNKFRCITIEKDINLTEDLRVHNEAIDSEGDSKNVK